MTRDSFRSLENQLVVFNGRLADASSRNSDGGRHYLLTAVRAWRWDGNSAVPLHQPPDATADHCWITIPGDGACHVGMLNRADGVARVRWYARADGTADLGLESKRCLNLDDFMESMYRERRFMRRRDQIEMLSRFLTSCAKPGNYSFSQWFPASEQIAAITSYRDRLARSQAADDATRATARKGPKPRGPRHFSDLLRTTA